MIQPTFAGNMCRNGLIFRGKSTRNCRQMACISFYQRNLWNQKPCWSSRLNIPLPPACQRARALTLDVIWVLILKAAGIDPFGMSHTAQAPGSTFRAQSIFLILRPQETLIWEWIRSFCDPVIAGVINPVNPITNSPCKDDSYDSLMVIWGMGHLPQRGWDHRISARHHRFLRISSPIQGCDVVQIFLFLLPKTQRQLGAR